MGTGPIFFSPPSAEAKGPMDCGPAGAELKLLGLDRSRTGRESSMRPMDRGGLQACHGGGLDWWVDGSAPGASLLPAALARWADLFKDPAAAILKSNRLRTVASFDPARLSLPGSGPGGAAAGGRWILKHYRHGDLPDRIRYRFAPSRAAREWAALRGLRSLGFAAPRPLGTL